ncbi:MAG: extracellular solute-binding protein family 5 [Chloroflexi bacterium]|nr:extracellular solute-binding protein family 5 [Chloroflexota bacterium]
MKKLLVAPAVATLLVGLAPSAGMGNVVRAATPHKGGTLIAARAADAVLWDPAQTNDNDSLWAQQQVLGTLVKVSGDGKSISPGIASSWQVSKDGRIYTFHINPQAKFCDGTPITSADVVYSYMRESAKTSGVNWQFPGLVSVTPQGAQTVVVKLAQPSPAYISYVTLWGSAITSKAYGTKVGNAGLATGTLGSGAFCLAAWKKGQEIDLTRNTHYWLKDAQGTQLPYLDAITWKIIPDDNARVLALQSGQVQVITPVPTGQFNMLKAYPNITAGQSTLLGAAVLVTNVRKAALSDLKVRQAMNYALDKNAIVKAVLFGHGQPAMDPIDLMNWNTPKYGYTYNLSKAKQLMAASKYPKGFTTSVNYPSGDSAAAQTLVIVKAQWAKIGIALDIKPLDAGTLNGALNAATFDMVYGLGTGDIFDPSENLPYEMLPKSVGGQDAGHSGWTDPALTKLVLAAVQEMNVQKRIAMYQTIQKIFMETGPGIWLFNPQNLWATSNKIQGFTMYATARQTFDTTWISQ